MLTRFIWILIGFVILLVVAAGVGGDGHMTSVSGSAHVDLPRSECWEKLRDLERAKHYVPGVSEAVITSEAREGVGASRVVTSSQAGRMDETVVAWEEQRGLSLRLHRGNDGPPFPFRDATAHYTLSEDGEGTLVTNRMDYSVRGGLLGRFLDWLVVRRNLQQSMSNVALAVAEHWETDAAVTPERLEALRSQAQ